MPKAGVYTNVEGKILRLSQLDKILYPAIGFRKRDVLRYYRKVGPAILPHLSGRGLTLKRYPDGILQPAFYEKRCPSHRPSWVETALKDDINYCVINDLPALIWVANLASIELHTLLSRFEEFERPTMLVFDLDPGPGASLIDCSEAAVWIREFLDRYGLNAYPKTSGQKGLQLYIPLNLPRDEPMDFSRTKAFARFVAEQLERRHPTRVVSKMAKRLREGKIFIDWGQNDDNKTTVTVYSLRATAEATVSTPLLWREIEQTIRHRDPSRLVFRSEDVIRRMEKWGDLFEPVLKQVQQLPSDLSHAIPRMRLAAMPRK